MLALIQRVSSASVTVDGKIVGAIGRGLLVFIGVKQGDALRNSEELANKVINLRIFPDAGGKMNRSVRDEAAGMLIVSQFTLYGDTRKGSRPSFSAAASAADAKLLYDDFVQRCRSTGLSVAEGVFQAHMQVQLSNDGPVTLLCRSEN